MDTLALGYVIPAIRAYSGLAPVRQCSCRAYYAKKAIAGGYGIPWRLPSRILPIELKTVSSILLAHAQLVVD